ncbi:MAG: hypothetical protein LW809_08055 [Vampirovibrionales bacterium]|jgi:hypothetical protein|nr:hypothetical protein [Vampirovibrionales bacterium]
MSEYVFKLKKGDLELELQSDDPQFIEAQLENWREALLNTSQQTPQNAPAFR